MRRLIFQPQHSVPFRSTRWPPPPPSRKSPRPNSQKTSSRPSSSASSGWKKRKKTISDDIRDVYAEAKGNGFDVKALRTIVRLRKQDANERAEQETILETYMQALGML